MDTVTLLILVFLLVLVWWFLVPSKLKSRPKIHGIYSQPNYAYPLKYLAFYLIFRLRKLQQTRQTRGATSGSSGYGLKSHSSVAEMERCQPIRGEYPRSVDAVYMNSSNAEGVYLVVAAARRNRRMVQTVLHLRIPNVGLFQMLHMPDTRLYTSDHSADVYGAGGLQIIPIEPMKHWKIIYNGKLRRISDSKEFEASIEVDWKAYTNYFDYDTDMHHATLCNAMATEEWSRELFWRLENAHQTHYEQFGDLHGTAEIEGHGVHKLELRGVRDHSYGNIRDWRDLHRYSISWIHLSDKTSFCIGTVCFPKMFTNLVIGYILKPNGKKYAVTGCDWRLYEHGEVETERPNSHSLSFTASDGKSYAVRCRVVESPTFYMGNVVAEDAAGDERYTRESRVHECMCEYEVNGERGYGLTEWVYRQET